MMQLLTGTWDEEENKYKHVCSDVCSTQRIYEAQIISAITQYNTV